jgi:hypothetical protein
MADYYGPKIDFTKADVAEFGKNMIALDTNILECLIVKDDLGEAKNAALFIDSNQAFLPPSVLQL